MRDDIRQHPPEEWREVVESPDEAGLVAHWLQETLTEVGEATLAEGARQLIFVLIEGWVGADVEAIDRYLTQTGPYFGPWDEEEAERHRLAAQGPSITLPTLRQAVAKLKSFGDGLDHWLAGPVSEGGIRLVIERMMNLLATVIESYPPESLVGNFVGGLLVIALTDEDPDLRALAALCCGVDGVPDEVVVDQLQRVFVHDDDRVVKLAAALSLQGLDGVLEEVRELAGGLLVEFIERASPDLFARAGAFPGPKEEAEAAGLWMIGIETLSLLGQVIARR